MGQAVQAVKVPFPQAFGIVPLFSGDEYAGNLCRFQSFDKLDRKQKPAVLVAFFSIGFALQLVSSVTDLLRNDIV